MPHQQAQLTLPRSRLVLKQWLWVWLVGVPPASGFQFFSALGVVSRYLLGRVADSGLSGTQEGQLLQQYVLGESSGVPWGLPGQEVA